MREMMKNNDSFSLQNKEEVLSKFSLKFINSKFENEYQKLNEKNNNKMNIIFAIFCLLLSVGTLVWAFLINQQVETELIRNQVKFTRLDVELASKFRNDTTLSKYVFLDYYLFFNQTEQILNNNFDLNNLFNDENLKINLFLVSNDNLKFLGLLSTSIFMFYLWLLEALLIILSAAIIFISYKNKKQVINIIIFCIMIIICSFGFHVVSGLVRFMSPDSSDPIFIVIAFDLLIQFIFLIKSRVGWLYITTTNLIGLVLEWAVFIYLLSKYLNQHTILYYLSVNTLIHFLFILISYKNEYFFKAEYYLIKTLNFEKDYLMNFVDNMTQGFITYNNKRILFINRAMNKIIEDFNDVKNLTKGSSYRLNSAEIVNNKEDNNHILPLTQENLIPKFFNPNNNNFYNYNLYSKTTMEKMFNYLTEINLDLPDEISKIIRKNIAQGFDLDEFFSSIQSKKNLLNSNDFTYLGILNIKNICPSYDENHVVSEKKYQVLFRIITHGYDDEYLEVMFSDISKVLLDERKKTLLDARSMYLSKIAHEFKNPLTSLLELSLNVKDEIQNLNSTDTSQSFDGKEISNLKTKQKIYASVDYSEKIYKIMIHFLKDFSVFSNLKLPCDKNKNKCENNLDCRQCGVSQMCSKCSTCKNCEEKKTSLFDYKFIMDEVIETFDSLGKFEKKNLHINYVNDHDNLTNIMSKIKTNKELFSSVIFNLIYHSYKSSHTKTKIEINSHPVKNGAECVANAINFEIVNEGFEVDQNFIKTLKENEKLYFEDNNSYFNCFNNEQNHELKSTSFNKYFDLYISFCILKKLNSVLNIESRKNFCKYSFVIFSDIKDELHKIDSGHNLRFIAKIPHGKYESRQSDSNKLLPRIKSKLHFDKMNKSQQSPYNCTQDFDRTLVFEYDKFKIENFNLKPEELINNLSFQNEHEIKISIPENKFDFSENSYYSSNVSKKVIRVLIIDDENLIRKTISRLFKKVEKRNDAITFNIFDANNCFEAINVLYQSFLENKQFDFVIIDEYMPFMKGSTLIRLLKQLHNENNFYKMTLISHTAFDTVEKKKFITESGADMIWSKPVDFSDFEESINKFIKTSV